LIELNRQATAIDPKGRWLFSFAVIDSQPSANGSPALLPNSLSELREFAKTPNLPALSGFLQETDL
jgi:hypothetical protein